MIFFRSIDSKYGAEISPGVVCREMLHLVINTPEYQGYINKLNSDSVFCEAEFRAYQEQVMALDVTIEQVNQMLAVIDLDINSLCEMYVDNDMGVVVEWLEWSQDYIFIKGLTKH